jgi:transcriptional regulator with XRE-family HTH domain
MSKNDENEDIISLGKKILDERKKAGLDQKELAQALGLCQTAISRFENNLRCPSIKTLRKIASILKCSFTIFVNKELKENNIIEIIESKESKDHPKVDFIQALLIQSPNLAVRLRSLAHCSEKLNSEDWQLIASHLMHSLSQVELLLHHKNNR